ncbi:MAG: glycosyltransferase [Ferruginibacter sp.]
MNKTNTILVLPSWYPSRVEPFNGDFIQRHIEAISLFKNQFVLYVVKDLNASEKIETTIHTAKGLTEKIIYYRPTVTGMSFLDRIVSHSMYRRLMKKAVREFLSEEGNPPLVHVHVGMKAGIIAQWIKINWHIPYIVSEHWTGYLKEAKENIYHARPWFKTTLKTVLRNASVVTAVSNYLSDAINVFEPAVKPVRIPNVVNTDIFFSQSSVIKEPVFIHASTMNFQKNTESIVRAMKEVIVTKPAAKLYLYGPLPATISQLIKKLHFENVVIHKGEVGQPELARAMQTASALVLYSRYETFGCVIIEAHASKLPVIVSDIPVFHELVTAEKNGFFIPLENEIALADAMVKTLQSTFDKRDFNITAYNYETVGKMFSGIYESLVNA